MMLCRINAMSVCRHLIVKLVEPLALLLLFLLHI